MKKDKDTMQTGITIINQYENEIHIEKGMRVKWDGGRTEDEEGIVDEFEETEESLHLLLQDGQRVPAQVVRSVEALDGWIYPHEEWTSNPLWKEEHGDTVFKHFRIDAVEREVAGQGEDAEEFFQHVTHPVH